MEWDTVGMILLFKYPFIGPKTPLSGFGSCKGYRHDNLSPRLVGFYCMRKNGQSCTHAIFVDLSRIIRVQDNDQEAITEMRRRLDRGWRHILRIVSILGANFLVKILMSILD